MFNCCIVSLMPNEKDWILLKKTISAYNNKIYDTWGSIHPDNAAELSLKKYNELNLFEFLIQNNHFFEGNTVASYIQLISDANIQLIYQKHNDKYCEILKILCTDKMILFYEQYHTKITEGNENNKDFNYRTVLSKRYEKLILSEPPINIIVDIIHQFKFMIHPYLEDFYNFILNLWSNKPHGSSPTNDSIDEYISTFLELYKSYKQMVPLIYRLINEYYLEYIRYQLKMINDFSNNSFIIISEYYENIKIIINSLPTNYVDNHYQDRFGNNMAMYLAMLPFLSDEINDEIYTDFLTHVPNIPLDMCDHEDNTIFHIIANNNNGIFFDKLLEIESVKNEHNNLEKILTT